MSEENELRVKFVIDDTDFRNQLDQLRADLERERRLEPGDVKRPSQLAPVQVMIGGRDGVDEGIARRIDDLERRIGLPAQLLESTIGGMLENLRVSMEEGFFAGADERSLDLLVRGVEEIASKFGADTRVGELQGGQFNPIFAGLRNLMDIINRRTPLTGRMGGLPKHVTEFIQNISKGMISIQQASEEARPSRTGISHPGLEALSMEVLGALGKKPVAELPLWIEVEGRKTLQGIMDVMGSFGLGVFGEGGREFMGYSVTEVATGFTGRQKERQVVNYANLIMDYAYKDFHGIGQEEDVDPAVVDAWFLGPVTDAIKAKYGDDPENWPEMFKIGILHTGGVSKELSTARIRSDLRTRPGARGLWETGLMKPVFFKVPEEALLEAFSRWNPEDTPGESLKNFGADVLGQLKEAGLWDELIDFFNPLNVPREELEGIFKGIVNQRMDAIRASGRTADSIGMDDVRPILDQVREQTGATRTDMIRMGDTRYGRISSRVGRRQRRPAIRYRYGRLEKAILTELIGLYDEEAEEVSDEELVAAVAVSMGQQGGIDPAIVQRRQVRPEYEASLRRLEEAYSFHGYEARMLRQRPYQMPGQEDPDRTPLEQMKWDRDEILGRMGGIVSAIPVEVDWQQYMAGLQIYAKEVQKEYGIPMTGERYLEWLMKKGRGGLPGDITGGEGYGGEGLEYTLKLLHGLAVEGGAPVSGPLMDFMGETKDPRMPVTQEEINFIRKQLVGMRESMRITGREGKFLPEDAALITRVSKELEAFENMYTRMEPATAIATMRWS